MFEFKFEPFPKSKYLDIDVADKIGEMASIGWELDKLLKDGMMFKKVIPYNWVPVWYIIENSNKIGPFLSPDEAGGKAEKVWIDPQDLECYSRMDYVASYIDSGEKQTFNFTEPKESIQDDRTTFRNILFPENERYIRNMFSNDYTLNSGINSYNQPRIHETLEDRLRNGEIRSYEIDFSTNRYRVVLDNEDNMIGYNVQMLLDELNRRRQQRLGHSQQI